MSALNFSFLLDFVRLAFVWFVLVSQNTPETSYMPTCKFHVPILLYFITFQILGVHGKWWQKLASEACCLWTANKICAIPATDISGWGVYENRGVWSEIKARYIWQYNNLLNSPRRGLSELKNYLKYEGALYKEVFAGKTWAHLSLTVDVCGSNSNAGRRTRGAKEISIVYFHQRGGMR